MTDDTRSAELVDHFKLGMRRLAAGVSLITTASGGNRAGLIATAVSSVSTEPPTLLICVNESASAHSVIQESGAFCVNVLPVGCLDIAGQFSSTARKGERFQDGDWLELASGAPVLSASIVAFDCEVAQSIKYNTHSIFIGKILAVHLGAEEVTPLIYFDRTFHRGLAEIAR
ncbi:flavin reductase family protein [Rhizobium sp. NPDC090275]|uniref:flavin reductase family protein n=1 Tax=Rhizobium sp. NPDC090275 TaxID=3364498 RepID=UPI00383B2984